MPHSAKPETVTVGGFGIDKVVNAEGIISSPKMGGNAAYSAVGALLHNSSVGVVGMVPKNYPSSWLTALTSRIDTRAVQRINESVQFAECFIYAKDGSRQDELYVDLHDVSENSMDVVKRENMEAVEKHFKYSEHPETIGAFRERNLVTFSDIPQEFKPANGFHFAPSNLDSHLSTILQIKTGKNIVTLDPGNHVSTVTHSTLKELLLKIDAFLPSEKEVRALFPNLSTEKALARLAEVTNGAVAIKVGSKGSLVWNPVKQRSKLVPPISTTVVDPTGAGDAYCGGFLVGLIATGDPVIAACYGTVSASFIIEDFGALYGLSVPRFAVLKRLHTLIEVISRV